MELIKTEKDLIAVETSSSKDLKNSKAKLDNLQSDLERLLNNIERDIDDNKKLSKKLSEN